MRFPSVLRFSAFFLATCGHALPETPEDAVPLEGSAWHQLSPDGGALVFEWGNDLWLVDSGGGEARRLVGHPGRDTYPMFGSDGKRVYFSSDRSGSLQVFSVPVEGGEAVPHTFHTEGNALEAVSPDGRHAIVRGAREMPGSRATRLMEIDLTEERGERRLFDANAHSAAVSPDGGRILFCQGGEQIYRKGYRGSRASKIWLFDRRTGGFESMVEEETDARWPMWHADGKGFYYVSGRSGTSNLWSRRDGAPGDEMITAFEGDGVVFPALSGDGSTLVFRRGLELFRYRPGVDPEPLAIRLRTREKLPDVSREIRRITGTVDADFTMDLRQVVFAASGDLWRMRGPGKEPERLTDTVENEEGVAFSPEGDWLYFLRDDGVEANFHRARLGENGLVDESRVTSGERSKSRFRISPGGERIAWVEGTGDVFTANADGTDARCVFECWDRPTIDWSPCGRWLALAAKDRHANRDVWIVAADGSRPAVNVTRHPAFDGSPRWSPDGRRLVFTSRRGGGGNAGLWQIDFGRGGLPPDVSDGALQEFGERARPLSTRGIEPTRVIWQEDSRALLFQSRNESNRNLYRLPVSGGAMRPVAGQRGIPIRMSPDGTLLWRVERVPSLLEKDGNQVAFPISMRTERQRADVLRLGFRKVWRTLGERFYDESMNGTDWEAVRLKYEDAAVSARDSRQFDRIVSQLLGELNASHLTHVARVWPAEPRPEEKKEAATAHPGLVFEGGEDGGPLVIRRVVSGSPVSLLPDAPQPGEVVVRIGEQDVTARFPLHRVFNGAEGNALPMVVRAPDGKKRTIELRCVSHAEIRALERRAGEARIAERMEGEGKIAWFHFARMNREDFEKLERKVYLASLDHDGMILDLRDNAGGRVADQLLELFLQPVHSFTIPRNGPRGYPNDRRTRPSWDKPLVVLCNENTFSNAEIFCHAVKRIGRAPLVGTATAGGVISAVKTTIPEAGGLQVPFRGWFHADTGLDLDLNGAVPTHPVALTPEDQHSGRDPQLEEALELLRREIAARPPLVPPVFRGGR